MVKYLSFHKKKFGLQIKPFKHVLQVPNVLPSSFQWVFKHVPQVPNVLPSSFQWVLKHVPQVPNVLPIKFPMSFQTCSSSSQCVPQHGPNNTSLYPISFALSSTLVTYGKVPKRRRLQLYLFWDYPKVD